MQIYEKIRLLRRLKGWSQEEMANNLSMSLSGYGGIERGETDIPLSRLQLIAKIFELHLMELFDLNEKNIFQDGNNHPLTHSSQINSLSPHSKVIQSELEKLRFLFEQQTKEIELLRQQNTDLRSIMSLLQIEKSKLT